MKKLILMSLLFVGHAMGQDVENQSISHLVAGSEFEVKKEFTIRNTANTYQVGQIGTDLGCYFLLTNKYVSPDKFQRVRVGRVFKVKKAQTDFGGVFFQGSLEQSEIGLYCRKNDFTIGQFRTAINEYFTIRHIYNVVDLPE